MINVHVNVNNVKMDNAKIVPAKIVLAPAVTAKLQLFLIGVHNCMFL